MRLALGQFCRCRGSHGNGAKEAHNNTGELHFCKKKKKKSNNFIFLLRGVSMWWVWMRIESMEIQFGWKPSCTYSFLLQRLALRLPVCFYRQLSPSCTDWALGCRFIPPVPCSPTAVTACLGSESKSGTSIFACLWHRVLCHFWWQTCSESADVSMQYTSSAGSLA